jgi:hypothetical protein
MAVAHKTDLKELSIPLDIIEAGPDVCEFFLNMVAKGESPNMAAIFAMRQPPGIGITDSIFISDQNRHGRSILDRMGGDARQVEFLRKGLAKNGYKLKDDDHYIPTAARFANDPEAVVNNTQTFGELKNKIAERGDTSYGFVDTEKVEKKPVSKKKHQLHPRIINRIDQHMLKQDPGRASKSIPDRRAEIVERHGSGPVKKD